MTEPAMLVLDDVPEELDELRAALRRRYGLEYVVICEAAAFGSSCPVGCGWQTSGDRLYSGGDDRHRRRMRSSPWPTGFKRVLIVPRGGPSAPSLRVPAALLHDESVAQ